MGKVTLLLSLFFTTSLSSAEPRNERELVIAEAEAALLTECGESGIFVYYDVKDTASDYKIHRAVFKKGFVKLILNGSVDEFGQRVEPLDDGRENVLNDESFEYQIYQIDCNV